MSIYWRGQPIPDYQQVQDALGRVFTHKAGRFVYGPYFIRASDIEFPVITREED